MNELHTIPTKLGDQRIDGLDLIRGIYEWDTVWYDSTATLPQEVNMFIVPQGMPGTWGINKDIGHTSLTKAGKWTYPFTAYAIHFEAFFYTALYEERDPTNYILHLLRNGTLQVIKSGQPVTEPLPLLMFPSCCGILPHIGAGGTQTAWVSNGRNMIYDYQKFPEPIAWGVGQRVQVKLKFNQNNGALAGAIPGETGQGLKIRVVFRGNRTRQPQ